MFTSVYLLKKLDLLMIEKHFFQNLYAICNHTVLYDTKTVAVHSNYTELLNQPELQTLSFKAFKTIEELQPI